MVNPRKEISDISANHDGRLRRSAESQQKIIMATIALIKEGDLMPSAQDVAIRAGVGLRSVFRHYNDMETLFVLINRQLIAQYNSRISTPLVDMSQSVDARLNDLINIRLSIYEVEQNIFRTTLAQQWRYGVLRENYNRLLKSFDKHALKVLPEIKKHDSDQQFVILGLLSFEFWDLNTRQRGLSFGKVKKLIFKGIIQALK